MTLRCIAEVTWNLTKLETHQKMKSFPGETSVTTQIPKPAASWERNLGLIFANFNVKFVAKNKERRPFDVSGHDVKVQLLHTEKLETKKKKKEQETNKLPLLASWRTLALAGSVKADPTLYCAVARRLSAEVWMFVFRSLLRKPLLAGGLVPTEVHWPN